MTRPDRSLTIAHAALRDTPKRAITPRTKRNPLPATTVLRWVFAVLLAIIAAARLGGAL